jgi:23S rRNA (adenine2030-N6)-methyltransferase
MVSHLDDIILAMNYKHTFHAGSFADVFKHCILLALVKNFFNKDKPIVYLETHAGSGCYPLQSLQAQKTQEYRRGISRLLDITDMPPIINEYFQIIRQLNDVPNDQPMHEIKLYPGSPYLVHKILRPDDNMILCELHPDEYQSLKSLFYADKNVAVHHRDGYVGLKALLPPNPRRGLVFIDPPFEKEDEITTLKTSLQTALTRWPTGTYVIWYPIKNNQQHLSLLNEIRALNIEQLNANMVINTDPTSTKLIGTGMIVLNPPWQFAIELKKLVPWLWTCLTSENQGRYNVSS